jgi:hypothetical protein
VFLTEQQDESDGNSPHPVNKKRNIVNSASDPYSLKLTGHIQTGKQAVCSAGGSKAPGGRHPQMDNTIHADI